MAEEEKNEGIIFAVGNKRIMFSDSSIPLSAEGIKMPTINCTLFLFVASSIYCYWDQSL